MKKIGVRGIKKHLNAMIQKELKDIIIELYKNKKYANLYLENLFNVQENALELLKSYQKKVIKELDFFKTKIDLKKAADLVKEYCQLTTNKEYQATLHLICVYYAVSISMFERFAELACQCDISYVQNNQRILSSIRNTVMTLECGFEEEMMDIYINIEGVKDD